MDVGERHRIEERLQRVLGAARVGLLGWGPETGQLVFSEPVLRLLGLPRSALPLTVEDVVAFVHPEDRDRMLGVLSGWRQRVTPLRAEVRVCRPQGDWRWLGVEGFEDEEGALVVLRDVHELRTREESETRYPMTCRPWMRRRRRTSAAARRCSRSSIGCGTRAAVTGRC